MWVMRKHVTLSDPQFQALVAVRDRLQDQSIGRVSLAQTIAWMCDQTAKSFQTTDSEALQRLLG
jgi:hypothetical protein